MSSPERDLTRTQFQEQGSLTRPGPFGRVVRAGWGIVLAWTFVTVVDNWEQLIFLETLPHWSFLLILLFMSLRVFPYVVTIGFGLDALYAPLRYGPIVLFGLGVGLNWLTTGALWSPVMGWSVGVWFLYTSGHLAVSFILASILATPGCEMRSMPHLWALILRRDPREHFCPGHIDTVDRWESNRKRPQ